ncbi:hypothetical protein [Pseudotamlana agarivorans]|uniref:hypothetical protein n=1 Tax=Pseudotamlana agarivorans TaxID=481183 RepID=UPI0008347F0A|nr:hypothetical protein [Tamlana agarivorans]
MHNFYIYKYDYKKLRESNLVTVSTTVIFCDNTIIDQSILIDEIGRFYECFSQTDEIYALGGEYLEGRLLEVFDTGKEKTFKKIPKRDETSLFDNIYILTFGKQGELRELKGKNITRKFKEGFLNEGLQNIFINRGGLVETEGSHHYVFPSGKHCDKFLRTGNILLHSCEINFIAFSMLNYFNDEIHSQIYCDSSSINSIGLALSSLKSRFLKGVDSQVSIESFSSYEGLYSNKLNYKNNALLIISASTSGNILNYITSKHKEIARSNIVVLYYLDLKGNYSDIRDNVLCNLTYDETTNPNGVKAYNSYTEDDCLHCKRGSYPVEVSGDVFLLEKPKINPVLIGIADANKRLSSFVEEFMSYSKKDTVLKVNYKEESETSNKYDIYIEYSEILKGIRSDSGRFCDYKKKLNAYINQFVPSNTRCIIHLNDDSSKDLSNYILDKIKMNYNNNSIPEVVSQDEFSKVVQRSPEGSVLVVGSCISNGKNLLYLSRALRNYEGLRVVYFVGITRVTNASLHRVLKSNLKQGMYGPETSTYIEVENIYCSNISKNNNWQQELEFLKSIIDLLKDEEKYDSSLKFFEIRKNVINKSYSKEIKGLSNNLFFPPIKNLKDVLQIRNNFAFFNFEGYVNHVTQSDIYFTFNNVINDLRNSSKIDKSLNQTPFVRNLFSPNNFNRFNDGIIQASILRSAFSTELSYFIDDDLSYEMKGVLETIIKYYDDDQGEALLEFLYAMAIGKLSLKKEHLLDIIRLLKREIQVEIVECFVMYLEKKLLPKFYR